MMSPRVVQVLATPQSANLRIPIAPHVSPQKYLIPNSPPIYASTEPTVINKSFGYISIIGGSLMQLTAGAMYSFGNLIPYLASYFTNNENILHGGDLSTEDLLYIYNERTSQSNWIFFVLLIAMTFSVYFGGNLELKLGATKTLILASILMSFGFGCTFFSLVYGKYKYLQISFRH